MFLFLGNNDNVKTSSTIFSPEETLNQIGCLVRIENSAQLDSEKHNNNSQQSNNSPNNNINVKQTPNNSAVINCTTMAITADKATKTDESLLLNGPEVSGVSGSQQASTNTNVTPTQVIVKSNVIPPSTTNAATMTSSEISIQVSCMSSNNHNNSQVTGSGTNTKSTASASTMTVPVSKTNTIGNCSSNIYKTKNSSGASTSKSSSVPINANDVNAFPFPKPASGGNSQTFNVISESESLPVTSPAAGKLSYAQAAQLLRESKKDSNNTVSERGQDNVVTSKENMTTKQQKKEHTNNESTARERKGI